MPETTFPLNVTDVIREFLDDQLAVDGLPTVFRPLRTTDGNGSIGIFPVDKKGRENTIMMGGPPVPSLQRYEYRIHQLFKFTDEQEGRVAYAKAAKKLWVMLYHDRDLAVALGSLSESESGRTERFQKGGITTQRFLNNELKGQFIFLASTEYWVETQTDDVGGF